MDIFHFKCPSCAKLMGVVKESLGKAMRCPHCQQVQLVALTESQIQHPGTAPSNEENTGQHSVEEPSAEPKTSSTQDTVDLDSRERQPIQFPESEMRTEEHPSFSPQVPPVAEPAPTPEPVGFGGTSDSFGFAPSEAPILATSEVAEGAPAGLPWENAGSVTAGEAKKRAAPPSKAASILFFSLVSYSIFATALLIYLIFRMNYQASQPAHPLENIPDVDGDNPGAKRTKVRFNNDKGATLVPLPPNLKLKLGQTARVGSLEITPVKVERKKVAVLVAGFAKPEPCLNDSLVLHLKLKNVSTDQVFAPLDPYFNRYWKDGQRNNHPAPYTYLQLDGGKTFFGGPAKWNFLALVGSKNSTVRRETVAEDNLDKELNPGEETEAWVCTDGSDEKTQEIFKPTAGMTWRVQFRRGLVAVGGKQIPATAVIGVEFQKGNIENLEKGESAGS